MASAVRVLLDGGCDEALVVVGARGDEVAGELDAEGLDTAAAVEVVGAEDWESGMGASLRAGLAALDSPGRNHVVNAALVHLVDIPDVAAPVVRRLLASAPRTDDVLARAGYQGVPGHPVLIGRHHWVGASTGPDGAHGGDGADGADSDRGARDYLAGRQVQLVECGDLASGHDVDRPDDVPRADQSDAGAG